MPRNRKIAVADADGDVPALPNSSNDGPETPDLAALETSNVSDHVINIESTGKAIEVTKPVGIFGKPMGLKPDPDLKRKWGEFDSTDKTNIKKAVRFVFKGSVPPWKSLLAVFVWTAFAVGISIGAAFIWPARRRNQCRFILHTDSFRVHDAYSRFERALDVWRETISCTVCNFATLSGRIFPDGLLHEGDRKRLFSFLIAFPVTLKRRLRGERDIGELESVLAQADIEKLQVSNNMPRYCLEVLNTYIMEAGKHEHLFPQMFIDRLLGYLRLLSLSMNKCERIREYSVNYGYLAHLRLFIVLWLILLPFSLVQDCGWTTIILCPFIAFGILAMEQVAEELSEPFGYNFNDIPIGRICNNITTGVRSKYILASRPADTIVYPADTPDPNDFLEVALKEYAMVT